jgi:hypothetical protein
MADAYKDYLQRFQTLIGPLPVGSFGKFKGRMIRKLTPDEFDKKHGEWVTLAKTYQGIIERGDTLNDTVTKLLREREAELLLEESELPKPLS